MTERRGFIHRHSRRILALAVIAALYLATRLPALSSAERQSLADRFGFERSELPMLEGLPTQTVRAVHPSIARHAGWISVVGASVALNDLDHDGRPNDVVLVDPRVDRVMLCPVPGTGARFEPFALDDTTLAPRSATVAPMGCLVADLNEDGRNDVLVYYWGRTPIVFLRRDDGTPTADGYRAVDIVPTGERWFTNAATVADLDGDGHLDLVIGNYFRDGARILDASATDNEQQMNDSMSRAFNAGRNRLLRWTGATAGAEPSVSFTDVDGVLPEDVAHGWALGVGAADLDGDLLPEIYFAHDFGPDRLLHNRSTPGSLRFENLEGRKTPGVPNSKVLGRDSFKGMGVDFGDVNADGMLDIYVSNIADEFALEESHFLWVSTGERDVLGDGVAPYVDRSEPLGVARSSWGWESRLADFDNDGVLEAIQATGFLKGEVDRWPELHELAMGNDALVHDPRSWPQVVAGDDLSGHPHNPFFVRAESGRFFDVAPEIGLDAPHMTRGIATADVDGDGHLDFAIANQWETSYYYRNEGPAGGSFLGLHLVLPVAATDDEQLGKDSVVRPGPPPPGARLRAAVGATATLIRPDGRLLTAEVDGGNGHSGARSHQLHFGLGSVAPETTLNVTVRWRDGAGRVHAQTLQLTPGWHTIMLGTGGEDPA